MKKLILVQSILLLAYFQLNAQGDGKIKELYLNGNFFKLENLSLQYKTETKKGNYLRIGFTDLNFHSSKASASQTMQYSTTQTGMSLAFNIGIEKRKDIINRLQFFYGADVYFSSSYGRTKQDNPTVSRELRFTDHYTIGPGLDFNSGVILNIFKDFFIAAEVMPIIEYSYTKTQEIVNQEKTSNTFNGMHFNFSNENIRLSLVYRWIK